MEHGFFWKKVLGIFKIALGLRDRHVFMWQRLEIFQYYDFETNVLKNENLFKKLEYRFLVERNKIENATFPWKTVLSEINV